MSDKGINIKERNYKLYVYPPKRNGKTEEQCFEALMHIIPHKHPFLISSKDIYDYVTKLLREKNKAIKFVKTEHNTYPSAEEWRTALMNILRGDK